MENYFQFLTGCTALITTTPGNRLYLSLKQPGLKSCESAILPLWQIRGWYEACGAADFFYFYTHGTRT